MCQNHVLHILWSILLTPALALRTKGSEIVYLGTTASETNNETNA